MRSYPLNRRIASLHLGDNGVVVVRIKPSPISDLPAGLSVERRVIENDLALFASLEFLHALPVANDRQHFAPIRPRLPVALKYRLRELLIHGIRCLLRRALPGS